MLPVRATEKTTSPTRSFRKTVIRHRRTGPEFSFENLTGNAAETGRKEPAFREVTVVMPYQKKRTLSESATAIITLTRRKSIATSTMKI